MPKGVYKRTEEYKRKISETLKSKGIKPKQVAWTKERREKLAKTKRGKPSWNAGTKVRFGKNKIIIIDGERFYESHLVWFKHFGFRIPKGYVLHHKDFNESNNNISNLQLMTRSNHSKLHNKIIKGKKRGEIVYTDFEEMKKK